MEHHTLGKVEKEIIKYLSSNRNSLIQPTYKKIRKDRKTVTVAFQNLIKKGLIQKGEIVTTSKGGKFPGYELTEEGVLIAILANADIDAIEKKYDKNPIMVEYKKLVSFAKNKKLAKSIVRKAAQLALVQEDRAAVQENPDALLNMAFTSLKFYSGLPDEEKTAVQMMADKVEEMANMDPEVKTLWDKKKAELKHLRKSM